MQCVCVSLVVACSPSPLTSSRPERHTFCVLSGRELTDYVPSWPCVGHSRPGRDCTSPPAHFSSDLLPNERMERMREWKGKEWQKRVPCSIAANNTWVSLRVQAQTTHLCLYSPVQQLMANTIPTHSLNHRIAIHLVQLLLLLQCQCQC